MTNTSLVAIDAKDALALLATASGMPRASTNHQAIAQAMMYVAGYYGSAYDPSGTEPIAWNDALHAASPSDIADIVVEHCHDTSVVNGRPRNEFPPNAAKLRQRFSRRQARQREQLCARRCNEEKLKQWSRDHERAYREGSRSTHPDGRPMTRDEIAARIADGDRLRRRDSEIAD